MVSTADYLTFVTSFPNLPPISILSLFFLGLMRMAPIVAIAPFLGAKLPGGVKVGLAVAFTVIMLPFLISKSTQALAFDTTFIAYALKELMLGFILAFMVSIPFYIAESAGVLIDFLRGSSALMVPDPMMQTQVSPIGLLYNYVLIVLFFQIDGPFIFLDAVMQSYNVVPADQFLSQQFFNLATPFWQGVLHLLTKITAISIQLAAPSLVAILMAEMFLGIANRLAPQVQIAFLGMSIKSLLGIALLWAGWYFILQQMSRQSLIWLQDLQRMILSF